MTWLSGRGLRWFVAAGLLGVTACSNLPPTQTENPLTVPEDRMDIVSVCYSPSDHSQAEVRAVALQLCGQGTDTVTPWRIDEYLNECPILKKMRVSFLCVKAVR